MRKFLLTLAVLFIAAVPAAADVCIVGPFGHGVQATRFEAVYGPARVADCNGRVAAAKAAGARPPTEAQYRAAVAAYTAYCRECAPSQAVISWIRSGGGGHVVTQRHHPVQRAVQPAPHRQVARPRAHRPVAAPAYRPARPATVRAQFAPPAYGGVTVICQTCVIGR